MLICLVQHNNSVTDLPMRTRQGFVRGMVPDGSGDYVDHIEECHLRKTATLYKCSNGVDPRGAHHLLSWQHADYLSGCFRRICM